ncbi:MAG: hypothetical protein L6422_02090, partial [Candidatus Marinimicrobia bacterium]|nr:hypothetical protein [Candidatus Neomarinimicrobiota bacterium]
LFSLLSLISLILTFVKQKITQETLSSTCQKTVFTKLFLKTIEVLFINLYLKNYLQPDKESQHLFIV